MHSSCEQNDAIFTKSVRTSSLPRLGMENETLLCMYVCSLVTCLTDALYELFFQEDNTRMREEIESLHRKFDALKRFASQKKLRLPVEFEQY